jgi:L-threonylcarbamoyladenylate synthase
VQPTALLFASVDEVDARVPEMPASAKTAVRALLPGPLTLVVPNPARRFAWLNAERPEALGLRVPALSGAGAAVLAALGVLAATSANLPRGGDPRTLEDVPTAIRDVAGALVDGGELPGTPSTVIDLTGTRPVVLREGAVPAENVLARLTDF